MSCFSKSAQSTVKRSYQSKSVLTNKRFTQTNNTVKAKGVNTARPKAANTARPQSTVVNAVRVNQANAVKASACWGKPLMDDKGFVDRRNMTGNIAYLSNFKEFDGVYVTFGGEAHGGRIFGKGTLKTDNLDFEDVHFVNELKFNLFSVSQMCDKKNHVLFTDTECLVLSPNFKLPNESQILLKIPRKDNMYSFDMKNIVPKESLTLSCIRREYSVARTPQQNGVAKMRNRTLIEAARTMLADSKLPTTFWAKAFSTACYVQNRVLVVKPHNKTPYELFRGFKPALSFMRQFGCHVTILNTLDHLGKFDGKSDELVSGTISNESTGIQGELNACTSTQKEEISQDCIVMPIWKDASYFDSPSKVVGTGEPKSVTDDQKQVEDGLDNANDEKDKSEDASSPKEVNAARQHVNTASPEINTYSFKLNSVDPSVNTASSYDPDSPKDMFKMGVSHTFEATHVEFFSDEDEPEVDLGNITHSYIVPPTPNTRIHKDHPMTNVIGYIEPTSIAKALSNSSWVESMQEELLQFKLQQVWILVDLPFRKRAIGTKWVFRNKKDERGIVIRNKARLVRQGTIEEEVYVTQPPGFKDPDHLDKIYKVVKALYGLHQEPRAWYETLANYLLGNGFKKGKIDQTLLIKKQKGDIFLVHVYVDDIIFGSTNKELCTGFKKLIKDKFQMSSMGELTFFLGLQV
ncbi:putative ribonuclease H-like domain-containing protein [Tanacetum coccineum]|uniref:Ribonuclease H-like domain-containing protein n=1 Tax=Tanacetum coccineum TaxID=301880 RepID=A0ABQ5A5C5_9ASTR